jgi:putative transcriptional regulator
MPERTSDLLADALLGELLAESTPGSPRDVETGLQRLLDATRSHARFSPFLARLAELFHVTEEAAERLAEACRDRTRWTTLLPGILYLDVEAGPALAGQRAGLVSIASGHTFPEHRHVGEELVLVLQGVLHDVADGSMARAGTILRRGPDHVHAVRAEGDDDLVYAVVVPDVQIAGL